ncbi:MAG: group III truncated hemoglobin [Chitinophagaceae bacterium]|nr:group III truncated hemoglobin [Chitinophagaceae bacterium]
MRQPLDNRDAIDLLVRSFYEKVKKDDLLGDIFNNAENFNWDIHIPIMVDFWETVLLDAAKYKGNTMRKHIELHRRTPLTPAHFERWKQLFYSTLDELFEGPNVKEAHKKVEGIGGLMQHRIQQLDQNGFSFM